VIIFERMFLCLTTSDSLFRDGLLSLKRPVSIFNTLHNRPMISLISCLSHQTDTAIFQLLIDRSMLDFVIFH